MTDQIYAAVESVLFWLGSDPVAWGALLADENAELTLFTVVFEERGCHGLNDIRQGFNRYEFVTLKPLYAWHAIR
jgi:hypothetical protein